MNMMKQKTKFNYRLFLYVLFLFASLTASITAQTGGGFDLSQNVIAGGGGSQTVGGGFSLDGVVGQPAGGVRSFGGSFSFIDGFWAFETNVPTAAGVFVSGRVSALDGSGIQGVTVVLLDTFTGVMRSTVTSAKGRFLFEDLEATHFYIVMVKTKQYLISPANYSFDLTFNREDIIFTGIIQKIP